MEKEELWYEYHTKKTKEERDRYLASLSDQEFSDMMSLPIGNVARIHLSGFRKSRQAINLNKYVIHIPHSSLLIPDGFRKRLIVDEKYFEEENMLMCDYLVDKFIPKDFNNIVKFKYSRMYCDVERYADDNIEEMAKYGMGVLYTKESNGKVFVKRNKKDNDFVINKIYKEHHNRLDNFVEDIINKYGKCFIIDLHSFSDEFVDKIFHKRNNPDICLGINGSNYDKELLVKTIAHFKKYGYSVKINYPYSGSIISNRYPEVKSMMIEINKRVYLDNISNYNKFYDCMMKYYELLKRE